MRCWFVCCVALRPKSTAMVMVLNANENSEGADEPAHSRSLIRAFAIRTHNDRTHHMKCTKCESRPRGYNTFFMLNSTEHEISTAHKN